MYKSVNGLNEINWERIPVLIKPKDRSLTRSNGLKMGADTYKKKIRNNFAEKVYARHNYFFDRLMPTWNALPEKIVQAPTLITFKKVSTSN